MGRWSDTQYIAFGISVPQHPMVHHHFLRLGSCGSVSSMLGAPVVKGNPIIEFTTIAY
jgi:hypothetical protein